MARPIEKEAETGSLRGPAAVSVSAAVQVQTPESNSANLKKLLLEKSGRLSEAQGIPVRKTGIDLQAARLKSTAHDR